MTLKECVVSKQMAIEGASLTTLVARRKTLSVMKSSGTWLEDHGIDINHMSVRERVKSFNAVAWVAEGISWRSGRILDATNLATLLCGEGIFFRKSWECYRDFSDSEEEDDGFSPIVGQFIDDNNNDELTEKRNINIADVDLEAVL